MNTFELYNRFLSQKGKVKAFLSEKGAIPFEIDKSSLKKAYPVLIASIIGLSSCSLKSKEEKEYTTPINKEIFYNNIYNDAVEIYQLDKLSNDEALPQKMIEDIMLAKNTPTLTDYNYNHMPENQENFWNIVKNGVKISVNDVEKSTKLSREQVKRYKIMAYKMLSQISRKKGSVDEVDLSGHNNLKAFSYFEKVVQFRDNYERVVARAPGVHDAHSEIFGRYYKDYFKLHGKCEENPEIEEFAKILYKNDDKDKIFSYKDSVYCNKKSYEVLGKWLKDQDIKDDNLYYFEPDCNDEYCNSASSYYKRGGDLGVVLSIHPEGDLGDGLYAPVGSVIIHELMHVMQRKPSSAELPMDNAIEGANAFVNRHFKESAGYAEELAPTLMCLMIDDEIYKEKNGIELNRVVDYGKIKVQGRNINLGELAIWFREKTVEYKKTNKGRFSADKMLCSPNVLKELKSISNGYMPVKQKNNFTLDR
ncbi:MAG: hypothetical protein IKW58_02120 [Alphaproteobacteria bacterium]|nr:hypothetical protein [Alphaproteobacteria bacterium]